MIHSVDKIDTCSSSQVSENIYIFLSFKRNKTIKKLAKSQKKLAKKAKTTHQKRIKKPQKTGSIHGVSFSLE